MARTSFYHYFNSKENFLVELFDKWLNNGSIRIWNEVKNISDPLERMERLIEIVLTTNIKEELFYFQIRTAAINNALAKKYLTKSDNLRGKIALGFFTDMGLNPDEAFDKASHFMRYIIGYIYTSPSRKFNEGEISQFFKDVKYVLRIEDQSKLSEEET